MPSGSPGGFSGNPSGIMGRPLGSPTHPSFNRTSPLATNTSYIEKDSLYGAHSNMGLRKELSNHGNTGQYDPLAGLRKTTEFQNRHASSPSIYDQIMSQGRASVSETLSRTTTPRHEATPLGYPRQTPTAVDPSYTGVLDQFSGFRKPSLGENLKSSTPLNDYSNIGYRRGTDGSIKSSSPILEAIAGYSKSGGEQMSGKYGREQPSRMAGLMLDKEEEQAQLSALNKNKKTKKRKFPVTVNLSGTRYDVVRQMVERVGFTVSKEDDPNSYLIWNDSFVSTERIADMKPYQKINHFPGMVEVCRKDALARNMAKISRVLPEEYSFAPKTWILPSDFSNLQNYSRELKKKKKFRTFIAKPSNGAMGNGIALFKNVDKIPAAEHFIVQEYIDKPFLLDGYKCDLRIYVLVTSCDPLKIFLYNDGLLRMSTERYIHPQDSNLDQLYMHLTNYSINKHSENFEKTGTIDTGSKRSLKFFNDYLRKNDYDVAHLWKNITDMIVKTMIVAHPHVLHAYRMCRPGQPPGSDSVCFEILGFDVLLDRKLRPYLLEINRSPSFGTDEKLDFDIKSGVLEDTLRLINIKSSDKKKNMAAQKAQAQKRLLRPNRRQDMEMSELEKKRQSVERKKEELKELLNRMRRESGREDFENRNAGRFKRIFPPDDKFSRERYAKMMSEAAGVFLSGKANSMQQEIQRVYNNNLREEDILDMIAQCEADELDGRTVTTNKPPRGPKPLSSMPVLTKEPAEQHEDDDYNDETYEYSPPGSPHGSRGSPAVLRSSRSTNRATAQANRSSSAHRPLSTNANQAGSRSRSLTRYPNRILNLGQEDPSVIPIRLQEEEMTRRTLMSLNDMKIKFPGKSDEEADFILDRLHENWKFHKPRIASYWLVKLDSIKRRKVIDIVRSNVRAVLQRTWKTNDIDNLKLYRIFNRVFNRLLWSHGQGLWNCFSTTGNSWETIFSKSTEVVSPMELNCCRRIVQLCRDCLLIVYQFAADAKMSNSTAAHNESEAAIKQR